MGDCESNLTGLFDTNNNFYDAEKVKSAKKSISIYGKTIIRYGVEKISE